MGRAKSYDRDHVARKAMQFFWCNGFHSSSTKQLANEMGINVYSLFAEFQSKQGLFEAALSVYRHDVVREIFAELNKPDAGLKDIENIISRQSSGALSADGAKGCLLCNMTSERGSEDNSCHTIFGEHINQVIAIVERAMQNAVDEEELCPEVSCRDQSALLVTTFQGLSVLARAQVDPDIIIATTRALHENINQLRKRAK
jgi:TetR/AcrR family transcriptional repressor of nem operon